jgi:spermidine/putrescine transport system ATP-binding protein/putrescine transport system ATP-binding protein
MKVPDMNVATTVTSTTGVTRSGEQALLDVRAVSKNFGSVVALDDVSVQIQPNEFFALLGPSGCGKTTLLRAIAGFEDPDTGSISILGPDDSPIDLLALPPNRRPVNLMFQSYALFPHMTVRGNVAYGLQREGLPKPEITRRVDEVLTTVALTDKADARPNQLSGGQRQRVALARAIVKRPRLLLLDEPLSALDRKVRAEMQLELKRLQREFGITFVVVTHDQDEAMSLADRIAVMDQGRVQQVADPVTLYRNPVNLFVADFVGESTILRGVAVAGGIEIPGIGMLPLASQPPLGDRIALVLRPEDCSCVDGATALLVGEVVQVQFAGGSSRIAIQVPGLLQPFFVTMPGVCQLVVGATTGIRWSVESATVLRDDA